jgi:sugar fermentation stimulation protein A
MLINMDSQAPNAVFGELLSEGGFVSGVEAIKPECRFGDSRFDFYFEAAGRKCFAEVKGVTLEQDGVVMFPDAPTERGVKHIRELISAAGAGYDAYIVFVVQMEKCRYFTPNRQTHPAFADALAEARAAGVGIRAFRSLVTESTLRLSDEVEVRL